MFTIKIYEQNWTFVRDIQEINDISFTSQINGGQWEVRVETAQSVADIAGKVLKIVKTQWTTTSLIYSWIIGKITRNIKESSEYYEVVALGLASLLQDTLFKYSGAYSFSRSTVDPAQIVRDIIDSMNAVYPLYSYTAGSVQNVGITVSVDFYYETSIEALSKVSELTESWWHIDENGLVYFLPRSWTTDHILTVGKNVNEITIEYDSENIVNDYFFEHSAGVYNSTDSTSITAYWKRTKYETKTQITSGFADIAAAFIAENKDPKRKVSASINSEYDFFTLTPGEILEFKNIETLPPLQIQRVTYNRNEATLDLEEYNSLAKEILT